MNPHIRKLIKRWGACPNEVRDPEAWDGITVHLRGEPHALTPNHILIREIREMQVEGETFCIVSWSSGSKRRKGKWVVQKCVYPKCKSPGAHGHHIVYEPHPFIIPLCEAHHRDITVINTNAAELVRHKLSNVRRWELWGEWMEGKVEPVMTVNAANWLASWHA